MPVLSHHNDSLADLQAQALYADAWTTEVLPRLPANQADQAKKLKAFQRARGLRCSSDLLRAILAFVIEDFSSRAWAAWALLVGLASISERAWCARLRLANPWLLWLLGEVLAALPDPQESPSPTSAAPQRRIRLIDATRLRQIGGKGNDWSVHLAYDLLAARMAQVTVTDQRGAERFAHFALQQGDLLIGDAGYGYRTNLAYAHSKGADVLVRIHPSTFPLQDDHGRPFDVVAWLMSSHGCLAEWSGWCCFRGQLIAVRLIASKLPPDKVAAAQQRKKRKAQKAGRRISAATLVLAGWWLLLTSLKASEWPATEIVRLYRARWQIELVFKRLKQLLRVASIRAKDIQAVEATIRAILLAWALQEQVAAELRSLLPRNTDRADQPPSSWLLALLSVQTLRQQVRGQWSLERVRECLPQLLRLLVPSRRKRRQQEADIREWLEQRLRAALPLQQAA